MPVLDNPKWEKFVIGMVAGLKPAESYVKAGFSKTGARGAASRLLSNVIVRNRLTELTERVTERVIENSISNREYRIAAADTRHRLMDQLREERAASMTKDGKPIFPGAGTGLYQRTFKTVGTGTKQRVIPEFTFDAALMREQRELEKQIAQDCGDWTEKRQITGKDGGPLTVELFDSWLDEAEENEQKKAEKEQG